MVDDDPAFDNRYDAVIIGAGFSGLYMLHELRERGLRTCVLEKAAAVGGTWLFNRYPGARCDIESIEYSYSFSDEIQQEWVWTETMPAQPEIEAYLNFVADRLDLRRDIRFDSGVVAMTFDEDAAQWHLETERSEQIVTPFVVAASGILSVPLEPDIAGLATFAGTSLYTSRWPAECFDFTGKRVGVIGTGSTGVQLIPVVAKEAGHLTVFQRSPAYTLPWEVRRFAPGELVLRDVQPRRRHPRRPAQRPDRCRDSDRNTNRTGFPRARRHRLRHGVRRDDRRTDADRRPGPGWYVAQGLLGKRGAVVLSRACGRRLPQPVDRPRAWRACGGDQLRRCTRTARRVDRLLPDIPARQRPPHHRGTSDAQEEWLDLTAALVAPTVLVHPSCNSWYNGGNVPGKKRRYMGYVGGIPEYRRQCDEIAAAGYTGFKLG